MKLPAWMSIPITPLLASLYPILFYWAVNVNQVGPDQVWRSLLIGVVLGLVIAALLWLITRDPAKSSLIGTVALLLFFSYGHLYQWFAARQVVWIRHSYLLPLFLLIFGGVFFFVFRTKRNLNGWVGFGNVLLTVLIIYSVLPIGRSVIAEMKFSGEGTVISNQPNDSDLPDLYLIILDEYPRADVIQRAFQYDNSSFLNDLSRLGFRVASCSQSNYRWTIQSIHTMLNLEYISQIPEKPKSFMDTTTPEQLTAGIKNSILVNSLRKRGYKIVALQTEYYFTELTNADIYLHDNDTSVITPFEYGLIDTTILNFWDDFQFRLGNTSNPVQAEKLREKEARSHPEFYYRLKRNGLDHFEEAIDIPGPKFIFAHLLGAHKPFVIGKNGEMAYSREVTPAVYTNQLKYVNERILSGIKRILSQPGKPPIILLLSDHGFRFDMNDYPGEDMESLLNLTAIYGPEELTSKVYETITPVNVLRFTANETLGMNLPALPDFSFFQKISSQGEFQLVENSCK